MPTLVSTSHIASVFLQSQQTSFSEQRAGKPLPPTGRPRRYRRYRRRSQLRLRRGQRRPSRPACSAAPAAAPARGSRARSSDSVRPVAAHASEAGAQYRRPPRPGGGGPRCLGQALRVAGVVRKVWAEDFKRQCSPHPPEQAVSGGGGEAGRRGTMEKIQNRAV